jgi:hypothetical protein
MQIHTATNSVITARALLDTGCLQDDFISPSLYRRLAKPKRFRSGFVTPVTITPFLVSGAVKDSSGNKVSSLCNKALKIQVSFISEVHGSLEKIELEVKELDSGMDLMISRSTIKRLGLVDHCRSHFYATDMSGSQQGYCSLAASVRFDAIACDASFRRTDKTTSKGGSTHGAKSDESDSEESDGSLEQRDGNTAAQVPETVRNANGQSIGVWVSKGSKANGRAWYHTTLNSKTQIRQKVIAAILDETNRPTKHIRDMLGRPTVEEDELEPYLEQRSLNLPNKDGAATPLDLKTQLHIEGTETEKEALLNLCEKFKDVFRAEVKTTPAHFTPMTDHTGRLGSLGPRC